MWPTASQPISVDGHAPVPDRPPDLPEAPFIAQALHKAVARHVHAICAFQLIPNRISQPPLSGDDDA
jgi:hypothetical protein